MTYMAGREIEIGDLVPTDRGEWAPVVAMAPIMAAGRYAHRYTVEGTQGRHDVEIGDDETVDVRKPKDVNN